tara:strand:- start:170 stop:523 length:354 start_codon:yes stop_codon:yes gene_type:complete
MTKIKAYCLENCFFSENAKLLLNNNNIEFDLINVKYENKDEYKKINKMNTFPQIFLETDNESIKIGGYDNFNRLVSIINDNTNFDYIYNEFKNNLDLKNSKNEKKNVLKMISFLSKK